MGKFTLQWDSTGHVIFWHEYEAWGHDDAVAHAKAILEMTRGHDKPWGYIFQNLEDGGFYEWDRTIETINDVLGLLFDDPNFSRVIGHVAVAEELAQLAIQVYQPRYHVNAKMGDDRESIHQQVLDAILALGRRSQPVSSS